MMWKAGILTVLVGAGGLNALAGSTATIHVDCSQPTSGDGSAGSPYNTLSDALLASSSGDTIQIDGGACDADGLCVVSKDVVQHSSRAC